MIRIHLFGDFWNRQPLAYDAIRHRLADRITLVDHPADAQIALFSHTHDLTRHARRLTETLAQYPNLRPVLLSEEPFWDTCWSPDPFTRFQSWGPLPYAVLNHFTCDIFSTQTLPYFLLTDPRYIAHYRPLFDRNAGFSAADWQARWQAAQWDAAFLAERRDADRHAPAFPDHDVWGLSTLRSRLTRHCKGTVLRLGKGWEGGQPRADLPDWHADKLARLDLTYRYVSAFENTHHTTYVTEKIFDAFAVGAVPLYIASKGHDVTRYVGPGSWLNLSDRLPRPDAPKSHPFDAKTPVSDQIASAYAATQIRLARLFADQTAIDRELDQLSDRLCAALHNLTL